MIGTRCSIGDLTMRVGRYGAMPQTLVCHPLPCIGCQGNKAWR